MTKTYEHNYFIFYTNYGGGHGEPSREAHLFEVKGTLNCAAKIKELNGEMCSIIAVVEGVRMDMLYEEKI